MKWDGLPEFGANRVQGFNVVGGSYELEHRRDFIGDGRIRGLAAGGSVFPASPIV
jgi:hypothetical protein